MYINYRFKKAFFEPSYFLGFRLFNRKIYREKIIDETIVVQPTHQLCLIEIFKKEEQYIMILGLLREKKLIAANSTIWIDNAKGKKTTIIELLKTLQIKGYYNVKRGITYEQIKDIAHNTFGVSISLGLIKHVDTNDIFFKFIPLAED